MTQIEFLGFTPISNEKHLGILSIKVWNRIVLRYKIAAGKNGGYFANPASYKIEDKYSPSFAIELAGDAEEITAFVRKHAEQALSGKPATAPSAPPKPAITQGQAPAPHYYSTADRAPVANLDDCPF